MLSRIALSTTLLVLNICLCSAQDTLNIVLLNDDRIGFAPNYESLIKDEIDNLLRSRTVVNYTTSYIDPNPATTLENIQTMYKNEETDMIIGVGLVASLYLSQRDTFEKPTIAGVIIDRELLNLPYQETDGTGVDNFTYIQTPFDVARDLDVFYEIYPYKKLGILLEVNVNVASSFLEVYFDQRVPNDVPYELIPFSNSLETTLDLVGDEFDALYVLSFSTFGDEEIKEFYHELNHRGIATFSLIGRDQVKLGAMAGLAPPNHLLNIVRRLALDVMNIYEGQNARTLPTTIVHSGDDFVINMQTLKHLEIYPDFDLLNQAILLDLEISEGEQTWSIESLIYEALKANLSLGVSEKDVRLAEQDIRIARSDLQPDLSISTTTTWIDKNRVNNSNGQAASVSWLANTTLNQLIYSEPVLANIAIQKLLRESQSEALRQVELDIILEAATAYLNYLQARSVVRIQNENVDVTNQNLNISESKEALGYSGISDVYRLRTQLSQNVIDLNTAISNLNQARINLNRLLNRDQTEEFNVTDVQQNNMISLGGQRDLDNRINNQRDLNKLTDFFVDQSKKHLPELHILEYSLQIQERSLLSNRRTLYLPQLFFQGTLDQPIEYIDASTPPQGFPGLTKDPQIAMTVQATFPIFQGGLRKAKVQKDQIAVEQIKIQQQELTNNLESLVRSNMEVLSASYQKVELSRQAADFSKKNFDIIQDLYRQGQTNIITLIDAQNASLSAELNATLALYQLIIDFLTVERSTGRYYFLMTESEKMEFISEFNDMILNK